MPNVEAKRLLKLPRPSERLPSMTSWLDTGPRPGSSGFIGVFVSWSSLKPMTSRSSPISANSLPPSVTSLMSWSQPMAFHLPSPLKRAGKRGEGKWKPIGWDQLLKEVTEGGKLFAEIGEDHDIEGFKAVHDTVAPINPEQPDLGPKSNQIIIWNTRADGRRQLNARFAQTFGTVNNFSHNSS